MASKIQIRRDTLSNWNANNPVLSSGEIAFVTDENKIKIGDGSTAFTSLNYLEADAYLDSVVMGDDTTGNYVETLIASDGISISGEGAESASVTITNTGVLSLAGTTNEIDVSASTGNITLSLPETINANTTGSAASLTTARAIALSGDVSGSANFDGSASISITATVADDSHNHIISNVDGLQTALDAKAPLDSPALTGTPTAPTASASANSTQIATTAFVQTAVSNVIDGAPGALDTLNELAAALGDDANFASTVTNSLAGKQPLDSDLTAIAGLSASATGYAKKTGDGTWSVGDVALGTDTTGNYVATISGTANEIEVTGSGSENAAVTLSLPATINANTTGSAASLTTARTISLGGDLSGSASFNGTSDITITAAVEDDSHNHIISNVDGLQTALDAKAALASPTFTGTVTAATLDLTTAATATAASHYWVATGSDGIVRPKTLANVRTEVVTNAAVNSAAATTVGTVTSGTWQATDIGLAHGGTNASLTAADGAVVYSTSSALALTGVGTAGQVLTSNGTGAPTWQAAASSGFDGFFLAGL